MSAKSIMLAALALAMSVGAGSAAAPDLNPDLNPQQPSPDVGACWDVLNTCTPSVVPLGPQRLCGPTWNGWSPGGCFTVTVADP